MENKEKTAAVQTTEDTKAADEVTAETTEETKPEAKAGGKKEKKKKDKKQGGIKKMLKTRKFRHGSVAIAITAIVVALVVVLNIIVGLLVDRFPNLKVDFTSNQAYALGLRATERHQGVHQEYQKGRNSLRSLNKICL